MEQYGEKYGNLAREKLFIPRSAEGQPNYDYLEELRNIERDFSQHENFVGVTLLGSGARGYRVADSDIDVGILYDSSLGDYTNLRRVSSKLIHAYFYDVSSKALQKEIRSSPSILQNPFEALCRLGAGPQIEKARANASALLKALPEARREQFIHRIVEALVARERPRMAEAELRITGSTGNWDRQALLESRAELWEKRVRHIFAV